jgi:hypothetical protein
VRTVRHGRTECEESAIVRGLLRVGLPGLLVVLVAIQLVPVDRTNPPIAAPIEGPPDVVAILERCCYDCHSNATHWPWYSYVAPASWLVAHDVEEGREHLNFSTWGTMRPQKRAHLAEECAEHVAEGEMPLSNYLWLHPDARPSDEDLQVLAAWSRTLVGTGREGAEGTDDGHADDDGHGEHDHDAGTHDDH